MYLLRELKTQQITKVSDHLGCISGYDTHQNLIYLHLLYNKSLTDWKLATSDLFHEGIIESNIIANIRKIFNIIVFMVLYIDTWKKETKHLTLKIFTKIDKSFSSFDPLGEIVSSYDIHLTSLCFNWNSTPFPQLWHTTRWLWILLLFWWRLRTKRVSFGWCFCCNATIKLSMEKLASCRFVHVMDWLWILPGLQCGHIV